MKTSELKEIVQEAYNEVMKELENNFDTKPEVSDLELGNASARLAQLKGELATILDKAERSGIISRKDGKTSIIKKDEYIRIVGDLPKKIKMLQQKLLPPQNDEEI